MSEVDLALGGAGAGKTLTLGAQALTLMPITLRMEGVIEELLENRARAAAKKTVDGFLDEAAALQKKAYADGTPPDAAETILGKAAQYRTLASEHMEKLEDKATSSYYAFTSRLCYDFLNTRDGESRLLQLMLASKQSAITLSECRKLLEDYQAELQDAALEVNGRKKASAPAKTETPAPPAAADAQAA